MLKAKVSLLVARGSRPGVAAVEDDPALHQKAPVQFVEDELGRQAGGCQSAESGAFCGEAQGTVSVVVTRSPCPE